VGDTAFCQITLNTCFVYYVETILFYYLSAFNILYVELNRIDGIAAITFQNAPVCRCGQDGAGQWSSMDSEIIMKNGEPIGTQGPTGHYVLLDAHFQLPSGTSHHVGPDYYILWRRKTNRKVSNISHVIVAARLRRCRMINL